MKTRILLGIFLLLVSRIFGQSAGVTGNITDSQSRKSLSGAHIELIRISDSTVRAGISGADGSFILKDVEQGSYQVIVSYIGYKSFKSTIDLKKTEFDMGNIALQFDDVNLSGIQVTAAAPATAVKGDTTEFSASSYKTQPDATTEDLIQKMPGVVVQDGKVKAHGEDVKQVLVDGRPFFGDDPSATLKNLPSEVVDRIQIFDQLSEQSQFTGVDDGNTIKTMNIVTRPNMKNSRFGNTYAGYGTDSRYKAGGQVNIFRNNQRFSILAQTNNINEQNFSPEDLVGAMSGGGGRGSRGGGGGGRQGGPGGDMGNFLVNQSNGVSTTNAFGLNYSGKLGEKLEISGSYFFNDSKNTSIQEITRTYILPGNTGQFYNESNTSIKNNTNHRINLKIDYKIDSLNSIQYRPRISLQSNTGSGSLSGETVNKGILKSQTLNNTESDLKGSNINNELLFRHRFLKPGRTFSITLNGGLNNNNGTSALISSSEFFGAAPKSDTTNQQGTRDKTTTSMSGFVSYTEPVSKAGSIMLGYSIAYQDNKSDKLTYNQIQPVNGVFPLDTAYSNTFKSGYTSQRAGLTYIYRIETSNLSFGLDWERSDLNKNQEFPWILHLEKSFNSLLPNVQYSYKPVKGKNFRFFYRTRTKSPSIDQLQNVINNTNPLQLSSGNPDLQQDYTHQLMARYSSSAIDRNRMFFVMADGQFTNNYIATSTFNTQNDTIIGGINLPAGAMLTLPVNLDGYVNLRTYTTVGIPLDSLKMNINLSVGASYTRTPGVVNSQTNYSNAPAINIGLVISSNISPSIDFTLSSQSALSFVSNTLQTSLNNNYFNQNSRLNFFWNFYKGFFVQNNLSHQYYTGLSDGYNQNFMLWNAAVGVKFLTNNRAEIRLSVNDILDQNKAVQRTVTSSYIEDSDSNLLHRYAMLTFTYKIKHFRSDGAEGSGERPPHDRHDGPPPMMGGERPGGPF